MSESPEAPYFRIIQKVADRLGMTVEDVDQVMDTYERVAETYEEESRKEAQRRRFVRKTD